MPFPEFSGILSYGFDQKISLLGGSPKHPETAQMEADPPLCPSPSITSFQSPVGIGLRYLVIFFKFVKLYLVKTCPKLCGSEEVGRSFDPKTKVTTVICW